MSLDCDSQRREYNSGGRTARRLQIPGRHFTATFIGSPTMNLIKGGLRRESGRSVFSNEDLRLEMADIDATDVSQKSVYIGIRPENVALHQSWRSTWIAVVEGTLRLHHLPHGGRRQDKSDYPIPGRSGFERWRRSSTERPRSDLNLRFSHREEDKPGGLSPVA